MKSFKIGVLINSLFDTYEAQIWQDILKITVDNNMSLICYAVRELQVSQVTNPDNLFFKMINPGNIDGLITFSNTLSSFIHMDALKDFFRSISPVAIVNIGIKLDGFSCVTIDNNTGMQEIIGHLIEKHHCRKLAFIRGTPGNPESEVRFNVYKNVLNCHNIPYNEQLVVNGDFLKESGSKAVRQLLDERKVKPDALISSNDAMALNAIRALQERGYKVPEDIAVTGFDDIAESRCGVLPLTTVRQPVYEIARASIEILRLLLTHREAPEEIVLPAKMKIRRSCGCFMHSEIKEESLSNPVLVLPPGNEEELPGSILDTIGKQVKKCFNGFWVSREDAALIKSCTPPVQVDLMLSAWIDELISSLTTTLLENKNRKSFLLLLENIILSSISTGIDVLQWYSIISLLFKEYRKNIGAGAGKDLLDNLWMQSLDLIDNIADYRYMDTHIDYREINRKLHIISEALKNIFDLNQLADVINKEFQDLGIKRFFLFKYILKAGNAENAKLIIGYDEKGRINGTAGQYPAAEIFPGNLKDDYGQSSYILFPLYINTQPFGFAAYQTSNLDGPLFESINTYLNNALQGANLFNQAKQQALELETKALLQQHILESTNKRFFEARAEKEETLAALEMREQEIRELKKQLAVKSKQDRLTNLYNRAALFDFLKKEINRTQRNVSRINRVIGKCADYPVDPVMNLKNYFGYFSVILFTIDDFKTINTDYGTEMGNRIMIRISNILKREELLRKEDIPGRFGDEEFIIILPNTNEVNALQVAERLLRKTANLCFDNKVPIFLSIGIAEYYPGTNDDYAVIRNAEYALDYARTQGSNRVILYRDIRQPGEREGNEKE